MSQEISFESLYDHLPVAVYRIKEDGSFLHINQAFLKLFNMPTKEAFLQSKLKIVFWNQHDLPSVISELLKFETLTLRHVFRRASGSDCHINNIIRADRNDKGSVEYLEGVLIDVTEYVTREEELKQRKYILDFVVENIPDSVYVKDSKGRKILANKVDVMYMGLNSVEEALGKTDFDVFPREMAQSFYEDDRSVMVDGVPVINREERVVNDKGVDRWLLTTKLPLKDDTGNIIGLLGIGRDFTERKKAEDALVEISKRKDKFFSIIAHDLKSPFLGLLGLPEVLLAEFETTSREEMRAALEKIYQSIKKLYAMIENLLEWSRLQTGRVNFNPIMIEAKELTDRVFDVLQSNADMKSIKLINSVRPEITIFADEYMIRSVLQNLVGNAIKFSTQGGAVMIDAVANNQGVTVIVKDTGIGIPEETQPKLFRLDHHITSKGTNNESGTGLGLILCMDLIEIHGGKIRIDKSDEEGSVFSFYLPNKPKDKS